MTQIRNAQVADADVLVELLAQLDYSAAGFIKEKIRALLGHPDAVLLVAEQEGAVRGFISLHFIPQIALAGDFCRVSYFCVDSRQTSQGIGKQLLEHAEKLAKERSCDRMELHCHSRRLRSHQFYERQDYEDSPKYFMKKLG
ncbi:GNAT family N-acetyltransferase [Undibacterium sp. TJN25]|uniref:GNAT family N-acetyltransferase n=1 Tax=Undibacterium sp. TJN25 TaxID=3413056 RepID=UPI003BF08962